MQPVVNVSVGGQWLNLVFDASSGNTIVFVREYNACIPQSSQSCYSYKEAEERGSLLICAENNKEEYQCNTLRDPKYVCDKYLPSPQYVKKPHHDALIIDGLEYRQESIEAKDDTELRLTGNGSLVFRETGMPIRLLVKAMTIATQHAGISLELFEGADGILGCSGPTLSCRNQTLWHALLQKLQVSLFSLDFHAPANAVISDPGQSRIAFNEISPAYAQDITWSQPKQTGNAINDGMHEFLVYHPEVCNVDLLYNTSSNWLTVIDTSGPCLTLPPFLFDSLMTRIPVLCPFAAGEASQGRLCSPDRNFTGAPNVTLPPLYFQLADTQEPMPPRLHLLLERLVFRNATGSELLCVGRDDSDAQRATADMMYSHIAFGSLAVAAVYTVVNLENNTIGLSPKGDVIMESTEEYCTPSITCVSPMQTYYPPRNICEDPNCAEYMFMTLDHRTKTCKWMNVIPISFGALLAALVAFDLISHRLYKQAIEKAREFCQ